MAEARRDVELSSQGWRRDRDRQTLRGLHSEWVEKIVEKTEYVEKELVGYTLTLTVDEAQVLMDIFALIGGDPSETRRGLVDGICRAMRRAGATYRRCAEADDISKHARAIYFTPPGSIELGVGDGHGLCMAAEE